MGLEIGTILALASTAVAGTSAILQSKAQDDAAKANARALQDAAAAREAEEHEDTYRAHRDARRQLAGLRSRLATTGTQLNDGSNQDLLGTATLRLETQIAEQARAAQMEARQLRYSAQLTRWEGSQAATATALEGTGTVLQGFGKAADRKYQTSRERTY